MKARIIGLLAGILVGGFLALAAIKPVHAGYSLSCWSRTNASSYADIAVGEGYSYGGGWWNNNGVDDTPVTYSGCEWDDSVHKGYNRVCEGPDCSGLTFKSWAMPKPYGTRTFYYWYRDEGFDSRNTYDPATGTDEHGPYTAADFRDGCGGACFDVCGSGDVACGTTSYSLTYPMDAFASGAHVAPIYAEGTNGYDTVTEGIMPANRYARVSRDYRNRAEYDGIRRYDIRSSCP